MQALATEVRPYDAEGRFWWAREMMRAGRWGPFDARPDASYEFEVTGDVVTLQQFGHVFTGASQRCSAEHAPRHNPGDGDLPTPTQSFGGGFGQGSRNGCTTDQDRDVQHACRARVAVCAGFELRRPGPETCNGVKLSWIAEDSICHQSDKQSGRSSRGLTISKHHVVLPPSRYALITAPKWLLGRRLELRTPFDGE